MNIYVGNLPRNTNEDAVRQLFAAYGEVAKINLLKDFDTGELRGFGFVEMPTKAEAMKAIESVNGKDLDGRSLIVNEAKPRKEKSFGGGGSRRGSYNRY
jgi:RNA recognition motif-containing protein